MDEDLRNPVSAWIFSFKTTISHRNPVSLRRNPVSARIFSFKTTISHRNPVSLRWAIASIDVGNSFLLDIFAITLDGCPAGSANANKRGKVQFLWQRFYFSSHLKAQVSVAAEDLA